MNFFFQIAVEIFHFEDLFHLFHHDNGHKGLADDIETARHSHGSLRLLAMLVGCNDNGQILETRLQIQTP